MKYTVVLLVVAAIAYFLHLRFKQFVECVVQVFLLTAGITLFLFLFALGVFVLLLFGLHDVFYILYYKIRSVIGFLLIHRF